ncbi:MAG: cell wall-active antibiotics response protein [Paludibacter sp.]|nr:cell wall-active antibiotics response protein [Paludibacter sp.]
MENKDLKIAQKRKVLWLGGLLITVGALFLLFNVNAEWQEWRPVVFSWQMLIIIIGIFIFFNRHFFKGAFVILLGGFFLLPVLAKSFPDYFYWVDANFVHKYWALLLVAAGVAILLNALFGKYEHKQSYQWRQKYWDTTAKQSNIEGTIDRNMIFRGCDEIFLEPEFRGGHISCIFGGCVLDLRKTALPEGETILMVDCIFGGVEISVPEKWNVVTHTSNILGGLTDSRLKGSEKDFTRKLVITGECIFGGVAIK